MSKTIEAELKTTQEVLKDGVPPIVGCMIADKDGKTILKFEAFQGAFSYYLSGKDCADVELIPMFVSALERMTRQFNLRHLSSIDVNSDKLIMTVFFWFERFSITVFSKSGVKLRKEGLRNYFGRFFSRHEAFFEKFFATGMVVGGEALELEGNEYIKRLNSASDFSRDARSMSFL